MAVRLTDYPEWLYTLRTDYFVETTRPASHHFEVRVRNEKLIGTPFDLGVEILPESIFKGGYGDLASERIGPQAEMLGLVLPMEIDGSTLLTDLAQLDRPETQRATIHQLKARNLAQALQSWLTQKPRPRPGTVQNQVRRHQEQAEADRDSLCCNQ